LKYPKNHIPKLVNFGLAVVLVLSVFERFRDYFQGIADAFEDEEKAAKIFRNRGDAGSTKEDLFLDFLKRHLPKRVDVIKGGFIFDEYGTESKQIDLIITTDGTIRFKQFSDNMQGGKSFNIIQGCYGAFSIKTNLDKQQLFDSLDGFASIPQISNVDINPSLGAHEIVKNFPVCIIFAFTGLELSTILNHLEEYYKTNDVPNNRKPSYIIVNNKFIITFFPTAAPTKAGKMIAANTFYGINTFKYVGAYSLWFMLTHFGGIVNFGPHMLIKLEPYTAEMTNTFGLPK